MSKILFYILLIINLFMFSCTSNELNDGEFEVKNGILDLREWDFHTQGIIELNGDWNFIWKPESFKSASLLFSDINKLSLIKVPSTWKEEGLGYGIYYLTIILKSDQYEHYGLTIDGVGTAGEFYINGELLTAIGKIGLDRDKSIPEDHKHISYFDNNSSQIELVVKISNFHHWQGGIWDPIHLGLSEQIKKNYEKSLFFESFVLGIIFLLSLYLITNFYVLGKRKPTLYLGVFCFLLFIRFLFVGTGIINLFIDHLHRDIFLKITYISLYLTIPCFLAYINSMFPKEKVYIFNKIIEFISTVLILVTLLIPSYQSSYIMPYYQIIMIIVLIIGAITVFRAVLNNRKGAVIFLYGFLFIGLVATNDILITRHFIQSISILPLGLLIFIFSQAMIITKESRKLYLAKESEDLASKTKKDFLANISHEIRTPLNSIIGFIDLVLGSNYLDKLSKQYLSTSSRSAKSLLILINDILDVSRLESKKIEIFKSPFELKSEIDNIFQIVKPLIAEKNVSLSFDISDNIPRCINADLLRVRQILLNLLSNSVKFTSSGYVKLYLQVIDRNILEFRIIDSGIGIKDENLESIFLSFTQADGSTARRFGGSGLGLTICKELSELMNGQLHVDSIYGKGSTFTFLLPMDVAPCIYNCNEKCKHEINYDYRNSNKIRKYYKILLAEDIEENATLATIRLGMVGHRVKVVTNGLDAVKEFEEGEYDVILMDIHMPVMDGLEASRKIRSMEKKNSITIIALTASVMEEEIKLCSDVGIDQVVSKPINFTDLYSAMEKLIPSNLGITVPYDSEETVLNSNKQLLSTPGINFDKGLDLWQDKNSYINALIHFKNRYIDNKHDLKGLLSNKHFDDAYIYCHTLKGVAGNLLLIDIEDISNCLCIELKDTNREEILQVIDKFENSLDITLKTIISLEESFKESKKTVDINQFKMIVNDLLILSVREDMDEDKFNILINDCKNLISLRHINKLKEAFDNKNYIEINTLLKEIQSLI